MHAIRTYGYVIHEFDPWFNFRATKYLAENGVYEFFHWFDRKSWYPLGRPIGTTIYPGMQLISVLIWKVLPYSLNDVCCLIPAWFGGAATLAVSLLTLECSSVSCSAFAAAIMAIVPAHLMRSVGGGYDNESVAITAMCLTFALWCRAVKNPIIGALAGLSYVFMAATWGGFVFVLNVIVAHAFFLSVFRYSENLRKAYTYFYVAGMLSSFIPVVGWRHFKDMELLPGLVAFLGLNLLGFALRRHKGVKARVVAAFYLSAVVAAAAALLYPRGYFGPISARVRGLFVKHTRTGNPLVDSVAEHQPASSKAFEQYLHHVRYLALAGAAASLYYETRSSFLWVYGALTLYFCSKMARLIILLGPAASAFGGIALGMPLDLMMKRRWLFCLGLLGAWRALPYAREFRDYSHSLAEGLSQPSIMFKARLGDEEIIVDDYREAYNWLRRKTPKKARILAWWDYGYQISGISDRTTLADGNTWNHEHIATIGRILTAPEDEAHSIARHLADYVLVWAGGGGDDLAKSPHMARIGNSVYHDFCPNDPTCAHFGFVGRRPTPSMARSLLFKLIAGKQQQSSSSSSEFFKLSFTSKFGKVKIFKILNVSKTSKQFVSNITCDDSWYCPGAYPPAIQWLIDKRKPFKQLEDFNVQGDDESRRYTEEYHRRMDRSSSSSSSSSSSIDLVGCYRLESQFPKKKKYAGGATSFDKAASFAAGSKYFAISRVGQDGHIFAFDDPPTGPTVDDAGCRRKCPDDPSRSCGCADAGCPKSITRQPDEDYIRRWVVYSLAPPIKNDL
ncbi:hypothetical protein CTAYLR_005631 [Chrysophaeum taylorii]|uniref:dolichyl-diphosphooligosaccharide--protein glycotransferase n=1 Tax=Chrysophaeum taylorii TaxID=2483200 RepID=A0AAD7XRY3_9STRA|nr:hypothetical protein CTAYLR_005631 [Chrysophaeum taylorii]